MKDYSRFTYSSIPLIISWILGVVNLLDMASETIATFSTLVTYLGLFPLFILLFLAFSSIAIWSDPTQFMRFPYYEEIKIAHLFDTMHIGKNVTETLWWMIDGRRDKEKIVKICTNIQESNLAMQSVIWSNSDGDRNNQLPI